MFKVWDSYLNLPRRVANNLTEISQLSGDATEEEWLQCLEMLKNYDGFISNDPLKTQNQLFPSRRWTFVHHAAFYRVPVSVVMAIREKNFVMSLKDSEGLMPFEHLGDDTPEDYAELFKPAFKIEIDLNKLNKIEENFHAVILERCAQLVKDYNLILPQLSIILETANDVEQFRFAIPENAWGFAYQLVHGEENIELITTSCSRVIDYSGQTHSCTEDGYDLQNEGF